MREAQVSCSRPLPRSSAALPVLAYRHAEKRRCAKMREAILSAIHRFAATAMFIVADCR